MSNRSRIEKFAKQNGVKLLHCRFVKNIEHIYGDSVDASSWDVKIDIDGEVEQYDSYCGLGVDDDVTTMLCEMKFDIEDMRKEKQTGGGVKC